MSWRRRNDRGREGERRKKFILHSQFCRSQRNNSVFLKYSKRWHRGSEKSLHQSAQNNVLPLLCLQAQWDWESISSPLWRRCTFQKWTCFYFLRDEVGVGSQCLQIMSVSGISFSEHLLILWRTFPLASSLLRDNLISVPFLVSWISSIWTRQKTSSKILMDFSGSACLTFV